MKTIFRLTLADKLNLKDPNKNMALATLSIYYTWKNIKSAYNNNKFKISASTWNDEMMNLISLIDHILFQTFKILLSTLLKKIGNYSKQSSRANSSEKNQKQDCF